MKQLGIAMMNYHDVNQAFPPAAAGQKPKQPPVSWRVLVLPYVEQECFTSSITSTSRGQREQQEADPAHAQGLIKRPRQQESG